MANPEENRAGAVRAGWVSDERILEIAHRTATRYTHRSDPKEHSYGFMAHSLLDFARKVIAATPPSDEPLRITELRKVRDVQGQHGNWNCNAYMQGLYNGLELAMACLEDRNPVYKDAPAEWLDNKVATTPAVDAGKTGEAAEATDGVPVVDPAAPQRVDAPPFPQLTDAQIDAIWSRMGSFWPNDHRYFAREIVKAAYGVAVGAPTRQIEDCPELNMANYDSVDVDRLNDWAVRADAEIERLTAGVTPTEGGQHG